MKKTLLYIVSASLMLALGACHHDHHDDEEHEHEHHGHGITLALTAYNSDYEIFADATPLSAGHQSELITHVTRLADFKPLKSGSLTAELSVGGKSVTATADAPEEAGIFHLHLTPPTAGTGTLTFTLHTADSTATLVVNDVTVYSSEDKALHEADELIDEHPNAITFTKEQSWQVDFATGCAQWRPIGQSIPTTAQVQPTQGNQMRVVAKSNGVFHYHSANFLAGQQVRNGETIGSVLTDGLVDDNLSVRLSEAHTNYETAKANYERAKGLVDSKIVSQKEFSELKAAYENAKSIYENLQKNVSGNGSTVTAPMSGYVTEILVANGDYVTVGQPIAVVSDTRSLVLQASVAQRYAAWLPSVTDAAIENPITHEISTLAEMNGRILSYGKSLGTGSHLLPVTLEISNMSGFTPGGFVNVWLNTQGSEPTVVIPKSALLEEQGNYFVFKQFTPEKFEKQPVSIGASDGKYVEVTSGLDAHERIVTRGAVLVKLAKASGALDPHAGHVH